MRCAWRWRGGQNPCNNGRSPASSWAAALRPCWLKASWRRSFAAVQRCSFTLADDCEITSEANPGTVDRAKFVLLRELGVNRLSLGVQSFQPDELQFLGRIHDVDDVYRAVDAARSAGFDNINLDFIFGLPHQAPKSWGGDVAACSLAAPGALEPVQPDRRAEHTAAKLGQQWACGCAGRRPGRRFVRNRNEHTCRSGLLAV
jgi:hypothetical protein